ncbi:MAG TPA: hypothetical protein VGO80_10840 [Solirubrobacteraceae bacterium]|jgi:GH24 family phage-related lysozyme (muramidase)|nr:hypothetical protein [Solirubrobacteraceae bacterium]
MTISTVSSRCLAEVKRFEDFRDHQYNDGRGVATIGYGTTAADVKPLPKRMSEADAARLLEQQLNKKYLPPVMRALAPMNPTRNMVEACVCFAYNLGPGAFEGVTGFETLTGALKAHDKQKVAAALLLYDNPNDPTVHEGLKRRRQTERAWFLKADDPVDPFAGYPSEESQAIREYDRLLRERKDPGRRTELRAWMTDRRQKIWRAAQPGAQGGDGRGWQANLRQERFDSFKARTS